MKLDIGLKYIFFELDGKKYSVSFHDSFLKGVYDVEIRIGTDGKGYGKTKAKIESTYPGLGNRLRVTWIWLSIMFFKWRRRLQNQLHWP